MNRNCHYTASPTDEEMAAAVCEYTAGHNNTVASHHAALIDMDGVLYDSMKYHTLAWQRLMTELGIPSTRDEFYLYEGMTGTATIDMLMQRHKGLTLSQEELKRLYSLKTQYFKEIGRKEPMPGADRMLRALGDAGWDSVLVTGSGQKSLLDMIEEDYPDVFRADRRVTALDVTHGKPDPEPYLRGLAKIGADSAEAIVIENAPLGVRAGKGAGCFTVAVTTGPVPRKEFEKEGADLIFPSMPAFADSLPRLIEIFRQTEAAGN